VGRILGCGVQCTLDHLCHLLIGDRARTARPVLVGEPLDAVLHEPAAPLADRVFVDTKALGYLLALQAVCTKKDHPAAVRQRPGRAVSSHLSFEKQALLHAQYHRIRHSALHCINRPKKSLKSMKRITVPGD